MTLLNDYLPKGTIVLDASVVINVLGCGDPVTMLKGLEQKCLIEHRTLREIRRHPVQGFDHKEPLDSLFALGALDEVRMTDVEYEIYLSLVSGPLPGRLDDGESAALAIAARGSCLILDERKARVRAAEAATTVAVASSLKLMLTTGYRQAWSVNKVREFVVSARQNSRMGVPREDGALLDELLNA